MPGRTRSSRPPKSQVTVLPLPLAADLLPHLAQQPPSSWPKSPGQAGYHTPIRTLDTLAARNGPVLPPTGPSSERERGKQ